MQTEGIDKIALKKVQSIMLGRYGKKFRFNKLIDLDNAKFGERYWIKGSTLCVPLKSENHFFGMGMVYLAADLPTLEIESISTMVKMILEPALYVSYLERLEHNLKSEKENKNKTAFVAEWNNVETPKVVDLDHQSSAAAGEDNQSDAKAILLVGSDLDYLGKTAFKMHQQTRNWAFAIYSEIKKSMNTLSDIQKLANMTLFVDGYEKLSESEANLIRQYVFNKEVETGPLFIVGVKKQTEFLQNVKSGFEIPVLEVSKIPFNKHLQNELFKLFMG